MQTFKNTRSDHLLAAALMIGALVLAVVSWQIPNLFFAPMTADMRGIVETVEPAYENTRMAIRLEGNSTRYTIMLEDYATLTQTPQVGDEVGIKYDITSDRLIRMLEIAENGEDTVVYESVNPVARTRATAQLIAFCRLRRFRRRVYRALFEKKGKKQRNKKGTPPAQCAGGVFPPNGTVPERFLPLRDSLKERKNDEESNVLFCAFRISVRRKGKQVLSLYTIL